MEDNPGSSNVDNCSCEEPSNSKEKRNKISLFGLCRDKSRRNKKINTNSSSSINKSSMRKSPKWAIKFNCTKKVSKNTFQGNPNCCRCTCYQHMNETTAAVTSHSVMDIVDQNEQSISEISGSLPNVCESSNAESRRNEPVIEENPQGIRGIYSISPATSSVPPLIITTPLSNFHWYVYIHRISFNLSNFLD